MSHPRKAAMTSSSLAPRPIDRDASGDPSRRRPRSRHRRLSVPAAVLLGVPLLAACGAAGLDVREHSARSVKKAVVGTGAAEKTQVQSMLKVLLPGAQIAGADAADALAVAIADAHAR